MEQAQDVTRKETVQDGATRTNVYGMRVRLHKLGRRMSDRKPFPVIENMSGDRVHGPWRIGVYDTTTVELLDEFLVTADEDDEPVDEIYLGADCIGSLRLGVDHVQRYGIEDQVSLDDALDKAYGEARELVPIGLVIAVGPGDDPDVQEMWRFLDTMTAVRHFFDPDDEDEDGDD